ncbi:hypothetical protein Dimus_008896, partial [Dionaea muscipula]
MRAGGDVKTADGDGVSLVVMGVGFLVTMDAARALLGDVVMEVAGGGGLSEVVVGDVLVMEMMNGGGFGKRREAGRKEIMGF